MGTLPDCGGNETLAGRGQVEATWEGLSQLLLAFQMDGGHEPRSVGGF